MTNVYDVVRQRKILRAGRSVAPIGIEDAPAGYVKFNSTNAPTS